MKQLNQVLIEGLLKRYTPDTYLLTNGKYFSIIVYIIKDTLKKKLSEEIQDTAKTVRVVGSLKCFCNVKCFYNIYYIDADSVEVKPSEVHKKQG